MKKPGNRLTTCIRTNNNGDEFAVFINFIHSIKDYSIYSKLYNVKNMIKSGSYCPDNNNYYNELLNSKKPKSNLKLDTLRVNDNVYIKIRL